MGTALRQVAVSLSSSTQEELWPASATLSCESSEAIAGMPPLSGSLANRQSLSSGLLLGQADLLLVLSGNLAGFLGAVELDVAVGRKVGRDATVGAVGSSAATDSALSGNVGDSALLGIEHLGLSVGLEVLQERDDDLAGFLREATIVVAVVLAHGLASRTAGVAAERHDGLVLDDALKIGDGCVDVHATASAGSLVSVLVVHTHVVHSALSGYKTS